MSILPFLFKTAAAFYSPSGKSARLSILIYHRVLEHADPMQHGIELVDKQLFDWQLGLLCKYFNPLSLPEALERLKSGTLPSRAICISFDDGYEDNVTLALPILKKHNLSATFFIASSFLNGGIMWNDAIIESLRNTTVSHLDLRDIDFGQYDCSSWELKRKSKSALLTALKYKIPSQRNELIAQIVEKLAVSVPSDLMMSSAQVRELHNQGMDIGGHTKTHPILSRIDETAVREEIESGKQELESIIDNKISVFAYPNGRPDQDYLKTHTKIVMDAGFKAAVTTSYGTATITTDPYQLPRFTPWDRSQLKFILRMLQNYQNEVSVATL